MAETPASVIEELSQVLRARADFEAIINKAAAAGMPPMGRTHEETMDLARRAGLPMPEGVE